MDVNVNTFAGGSTGARGRGEAGGGRRGSWAATGGDVSAGGKSRYAIGGAADAATEYGTESPLIKVSAGARSASPLLNGRARGRLHSGAVCDSFGPLGRRAGGPGRDGHRLGASTRGSPAVPRGHRAGVRVLPEAHVRDSSRHTTGPQHSGLYQRLARLLPQRARAASDLRSGYKQTPTYSYIHSSFGPKLKKNIDKLQSESQLGKIKVQ